MPATSPLGRIVDRLSAQLDALHTIVSPTNDTALRRQPAGKWSALENLAHVARHQQVFANRIKDILELEAPAAPAYRAENDPDWPQWQALPGEEIVRRLHSGQGAIIDLVRPLSAGQFERVGVHSVFGPMTLVEWLDFFLLHQAHHFFVAMKRARGGT